MFVVSFANTSIQSCTETESSRKLKKDNYYKHQGPKHVTIISHMLAKCLQKQTNKQQTNTQQLTSIHADQIVEISLRRII